MPMKKPTDEKNKLIKYVLPKLSGLNKVKKRFT
jgi:hypothetical protein